MKKNLTTSVLLCATLLSYSGHAFGSELSTENPERGLAILTSDSPETRDPIDLLQEGTSAPSATTHDLLALYEGLASTQAELA